MLQPHLVNDEDLVVLLGNLLPTVGDVAAAVLGVHLNTIQCIIIDEISGLTIIVVFFSKTTPIHFSDKVACIICQIGCVEKVVIVIINNYLALKISPCPQQRSPRVWPAQCREDHCCRCIRPGRLQWGCDLGGEY